MERKLSHWSSFAKLSVSGRFARYQTSKLDIMRVEFPTSLNSILNPVSAKFHAEQLLLFKREKRKLSIRQPLCWSFLFHRRRNRASWSSLVRNSRWTSAKDRKIMCVLRKDNKLFKKYLANQSKWSGQSLDLWLLVFIEGLIICHFGKDDKQIQTFYYTQADFVKCFILLYIILHDFILLYTLKYIYVHIFNYSHI